MTQGLSLEFVGLEETTRAFVSLDERVSDMRHVSPGLAEETYAQAERTINEQDYEDLTKAYARKKEKLWGSKPILVASGEMATALTSSSHRDSVYEASEDELIIGVRGESGVKASAHQYGTDTLPARPVYVITDLFKEMVQERVRDDLSAYARQLGFAVQ